MTNVIGDLTISVERTLDVDGETVFDVLADPETLGAAERVAREETRASPGRARAPGAGVRDPPPRLRRGDTFVGAVAVPGGREDRKSVV